MAKVLIDTDVLIDVFRGDEVRDAMLKAYDGYISSVVYVELIQGENTSRKEIKIIKNYLSRFTLLHINEQISELAVALVEEYGPSHNLKLADALIASTALFYDLSLNFLNKKDYGYLPNLDMI